MFGPDGVDGAPGIVALTGMSPADATDRIAAWQRAFDWTSRPDLVSIAAVQGHAIGAGFQLALGTDIRILADDAQLTMAEPRLGIVPDLGGTKRLVDLVGYSRAAEICLTARPVDAQEALRIGLASAAVPAAELDAAVERTVAAVLGVNRDAATETKALLLGAAARTQSEQERAEREAQYRRLRALVGLDRED
jgi:enoyl-CoA hydratase/carnithine racemase